MIRELLVDFLTAEGFQVEEAHDGAEAMGLVAGSGGSPGHLCAILLDMMLPIVDGITILRHVVAQGIGVPVVALSASRERLAEAMLAGATIAVAKPFDVTELISTVATHCPREGA